VIHPPVILIRARSPAGSIGLPGIGPFTAKFQQRRISATPNLGSAEFQNFAVNAKNS
jgi:hypothetical protein